MEPGKLHVRKSKKGLSGEIEITGKKMPVPQHFILELTLDGKECEVERNGGQIERIMVEGNELGKKQKQQKTRMDLGKGINSQEASASQNLVNLFPVHNSKLPLDSRETLKDVDPDNYALKLNKLVNFINEKALLFKREWQDKEDGKKWKFEINHQFNNPFLEHLINRQKRTLSIIPNLAHAVVRFIPDWRLIIGIGNESVYETAITLHHVYGIPYIPAQALKGITRGWIITELFNNKEKDALQDKYFCFLFGSPKESTAGEQQGSLMFFDGFPVSTPQIKLDVMNPHYGDYYQNSDGKTPPTDDLNPVPIPFLTVADTQFDVIIAIKEDKNHTLHLYENSRLLQDNGKRYGGLSSGSTCLDVGKFWLKKALEEHGIGAKTAVGYGYGTINCNQ
jgi:CRISPR-associated protein Cmr6